MKVSHIFFGILFILAIGAGIYYVPSVYVVLVTLNTRESESEIIVPAKPTWQATFVKAPSGDNIHTYYSVDDLTGYGVRYENRVSTFFKTTDGGKSWAEQSAFDRDVIIRTAGFPTTDTGFIAISKTDSSPSQSTSSTLLRTDDGGKTWKTIYSLPSTRAYSLNFDSKGVGFLTGVKEYEKIPDYYWKETSSLILVTTDSGENWSDISENFDAASMSSAGYKSTPLRLFFTKNYGTLVLGSGRRIYNSDDNGESWHLVSYIYEEPDQTGFNNLGELENGKLWAAGGARSIEGVWTVIATSKILGWDKYRLSNQYLDDVQFISDNEVIASGIEEVSVRKDTKNSLILYSPNRGKNWEIAYKGATETGTFYISKASKDKIILSDYPGNQIILERIAPTD